MTLLSCLLENEIHHLPECTATRSRIQTRISLTSSLIRLLHLGQRQASFLLFVVPHHLCSCFDASWSRRDNGRALVQVLLTITCYGYYFPLEWDRLCRGTLGNLWNVILLT